MNYTDNEYQELDRLYQKIKQNIHRLPQKRQGDWLDALDDLFRDWETKLEELLPPKNSKSSKKKADQPLKIPISNFTTTSNRQTFDVELEDGKIVTAELLSVVEIDQQEYAIYCIPSCDAQDGKVDILASYVFKDSEGYDYLSDITNPSDKKKVSNFIQNLLTEGNLL